MEQHETFKMTYSAQQQEEVLAIRKKYMPPEENKLEQLRALDASVRDKATALSIGVGVVGTLMLGLGMSLTLSEFGAAFGTMATPCGILVGLLGLAALASAYPLYHRTLKKEREKIAPEILRLSDELLK